MRLRRRVIGIAFSPETVFYTELLKDVNPALVKWESKAEVK